MYAMIVVWGKVIQGEISLSKRCRKGMMFTKKSVECVVMCFDCNVLLVFDFA